MAAIERRVEIFIMEISRSSYSCLNQVFDNFPSSHMVFMLSDAALLGGALILKINYVSYILRRIKITSDRYRYK